jgi:hypothetical protein
MPTTNGSPLQRDVGGVRGGQPLPGSPACQRYGAASVPRPAGVDRPVRGDGEQPRAEVHLAATESGQACHHAQPGLGGHVLGRVRRDHPHVAQSDELVYGRPEPEWGELEEACLAFLLDIARYRLTTYTCPVTGDLAPCQRLTWAEESLTRSSPLLAERAAACVRKRRREPLAT